MEQMDIDVVGGQDVQREPDPLFLEDVKATEHLGHSAAEIEYKEPLQPPPPAAELAMEEEHHRLHANESDDLAIVLKNFPNTTHLTFDSETTLSNQVIWNLKLIPKFKHLRKITLMEYGENAYIPKSFAKSPTCTHLAFVNCSFHKVKYYRTHRDKGFANAIRKNKVLQSLTFLYCKIGEDLLKIILQSESITELRFVNTQIKQRSLPSILLNQNLTKFEYIVNRTYIEGITPNEVAQIERHVSENRQRLMVFPVLAAMQLGDPTKAAIVDILPEISRMLGDPPISRERAVEIVQQIEPIVKLGRRTRLQTRETPLPFMFQRDQPPSAQPEPMAIFASAAPPSSSTEPMQF